MQHMMRKALQSHHNVNAEIEYFTDKCGNVPADLVSLWQLLEEQAGLKLFLLLALATDDEGRTHEWWLVFHGESCNTFDLTEGARKPGAATLNAAMRRPDQATALSTAFRLGGLDGSEALGVSLGAHQTPLLAL
jgi:hypothetical protein